MQLLIEGNATMISASDQATKQPNATGATEYWENYDEAASQLNTGAIDGEVGGEEQILYTTETDGGGEANVEVAVPALPDIRANPPSLNVHDLKWNKHIQDLKAFKDQHGHIQVPRTEDHKKLYRFLDNQGQNYRKLIEGKKSTLTVQRIRDLDELGIKWKVEPEQIIVGLPQESQQANQMVQYKAKQSESWESRFEQLKQFHARSGHFRVPYKQGTKRSHNDAATEIDKETLQLGSWVKRQRSSYASDTLRSDRVDRLKSINFDFKPGRQTKNERAEVQLALLDGLRRRRELNAAQVADLDRLYDEWKCRAESNSYTSVNHNNKHSINWANNFEKLKDFKLKHGHLRVPRDRSHDEDGKELRSLSKWVDSQRDQYARRKRGDKVALDDERISRLESIGFVWSLRPYPPLLQTKKSDRSIPVVDVPTNLDLSRVFLLESKDLKEGVSNVYQYKWESKLEEFKRYKTFIGLPRVTAKVIQIYPNHLQRLQELRKWIDNQRTFYHNGICGKKNRLSNERIRLLLQAGFDFGSQKGKPVHFKSWNQKVEELKEFKAKHGHTRVRATEKSDSLYKLYKWVQNQRNSYWMYMKGEKSCMNEERLEVLESLGFEWRVKPGRDSKYTEENNGGTEQSATNNNPA